MPSRFKETKPLKWWWRALLGVLFLVVGEALGIVGYLIQSRTYHLHLVFAWPTNLLS